MATKYQKITLIILLLGLAVAMALVNTKQEIRKKASLSGGVASLSLSPSTINVSSGQNLSFNIDLNTAGVAISGFQTILSYPVIAGVSAPTLTIKPEFDSNGWTCPVKMVTQVNSQNQIDIACVFISVDGFSSATPVTIATLDTTTTASFNIDFDAIQTVITRKSDAADIAAIPASPASVVTVAVAVASPTPFVITNPTINYMNFDGVNDTIRTSPSASINSIKSEVTLETWVKRNSLNKYMTAVALHDGTNNIIDLNLYNNTQNPAPGLYSHIRIGDVGVFPESGYGPKVNSEEWHHFAITYTSGLHRGFMDGNLIFTGTNKLGALNYSQGMLQILIGSSSLGEFMHGQIGEVAVFNTARTAEQIRTDYEAQKLANNLPGLVGLWHFDNGSLLDSSGNNNHGYTDVPKNLKAECSADGAQVDLSWDAVSGASKYILNINDPSNDSPSCDNGWGCANSLDYGNGNLASNSYTHKIVPGRDYQWWAHSVVNDIISDTVKNTFNCPPPLVITNPTINYMNFDGVNDYVRVPDSDKLDPSQITIEAWVNLNGTPTDEGNIVSKSSNDGYRFRVGNDLRVSWFDRGCTYDNHIGNCISTNPNLIQPNVWSHIAVTGNASGLRIYINGQLASSNSVAYGAPNAPGDLLIGTDIGNSEWYKGKIGEVAIFNTARTAEQILADYSAQKLANNLPGLVGLWHFENGSLLDSSGNNNHGYTDVPKNLKAECSADGTSATLSWDAVPNASKYIAHLNYKANDKTSCESGWSCANSPDKSNFNLSINKWIVSVIPETQYDYWTHTEVNGLLGDTATLSFTCSLPTTKTSSEIKDDFNGSLDVSKWNLLKYPSGAPVQSQIKDQAFTHYIAGLKENIAAVADTKPVSGDFDVSADLKINSSNSSSSTVDLIFHDDAWKNTLGITVSNLGGVYGFSMLDSKQVNTDIKTGLTNPLTVRIIRIGNNVYYYYKSSLGYTLLGSFAGIYTGRGNFALQTTTNKPDYPDVTGTFDNFVAKVNEIAPSPTPGATNSCGGTCGSNSNCNAGLVCHSGFCRNPQCKENKDCNCASAPSAPTPTPVTVTKKSLPTPTPYRTTQYLQPTPAPAIMTKPTPKTDMRIYNLDLETPAPAPTPQKQSFFGKVVGFILKLFGIRY